MNQYPRTRKYNQGIYKLIPTWRVVHEHKNCSHFCRYRHVMKNIFSLHLASTHRRMTRAFYTTYPCKGLRPACTFFSIMTRLFVIFFRLAFFSGSFSGFFSGSVRESGTPSVRPSENLPLHVCKFKVTGPRWFCTCFGRPPAVAPVHGKDDRGPPGRLHSFCNRSRLNNRYMVRCH